jgi:CheY-like chemotaxis protein
MEPKGREHRLLAIKKDPISTALMGEMLDGEGFLLDAVYTAAQGLARVRSSPPDIVMLGMFLNDSGGLELLERLRREPATAALPVVMASSFSEDDWKWKAVEAGADGYLHQPFTKEQLLSSLRKALAIRRAPVERTSPPKSVLVIDDDESMLDYCRPSWRAWGCRSPPRAPGSRPWSSSRAEASTCS